jgi:hypothetical protein
MTLKPPKLPHRRRAILINPALVLTLAAGVAACGSVDGALVSQSGLRPTSASSAPLPACPVTVGSTIPPVGKDYRVQVPVLFGWLPAHLVGSVVQGPSNGVSSPATYIAMAENGGLSISVTAFPDANRVPGQHQPSAACARPSDLPSPPPTGAAPNSTPVRPAGPPVAAPPVNGAPAYWYAGPSYPLSTVEQLVWKSPLGTWISVAATNWDPATVKATLEHVAKTLTIGDLPLPLPVQIKGIPAAYRMRVAKILDTQILPGNLGYPVLTIDLRFGPEPFPAQATIYVLPAGHKDVLMPRNSPCETANDLSVCVAEDTYDATTEGHRVPGGPAALLAHVISLGSDQAHWSPNLVVGTR